MLEIGWNYSDKLTSKFTAMTHTFEVAREMLEKNKRIGNRNKKVLTTIFTMFHEIVPNSFKRQNNEVLVVKSNVRSSKSANIKKPEE